MYQKVDRKTQQGSQMIIVYIIVAAIVAIIAFIWMVGFIKILHLMYEAMRATRRTKDAEIIASWNPPSTNEKTTLQEIYVTLHCDNLDDKQKLKAILNILEETEII